MSEISVVIPTHNPNRERLRRTLDGLRAQTLPADRWEVLLVDNASSPAVDESPPGAMVSGRLRVVREPKLGLTAARRRGFSEARSPAIVLVDDDNVLAPDYLAQVLRLFEAHPRVGAAGGRSEPEFEIPPPPWVREFEGLLACRDLGEIPQFSHGLRDPTTGRNEYPLCAPIGAGMAIRQEAVQAWLDDRSAERLSDRRGGDLSSSGDNDIVFAIMRRGWEVAYFPELRLTHLIPAERLEARYLARLNRGIQKSWMQVLTKHDANPWPPIAPWTAPLRRWKAWGSGRAWSGPAARIRWQGACGHFDGRRRGAWPGP